MEYDERLAWKAKPSIFPERPKPSNHSLLGLLLLTRRLHPAYPKITLAIFSFAARHAKNKSSLKYAYTMLCLLQYEKIYQALDAGRQQEAADLKNELYDTFLHHRELARGAMSPDILSVQQGEIGVSSTKQLGTYNVHSCICIIIRNPLTKKTIMAHPSPSSELGPYEQLLEAEVDSDESWEAFVFGDRYQDKASLEMLHKIKRILDHKKIRIQTADLFNSEQPSSISVDPLTGEITETAPLDTNLDAILRASYGDHGLRLAFQSEDEYEKNFFCNDLDVLEEARHIRSVIDNNPIRDRLPTIEQLLGPVLMQAQHTALDRFALPDEVTEQILQQRGLYTKVQGLHSDTQDIGPNTQAIFEATATFVNTVNGSTQAGTNQL